MIQDHLKEKDVVTGICSVGHDLQPSIYIWSNKGFGHYMPKGVEKIDGTGGYFLGISKRIYNKLPIHPFERISGFGNDLSFCKRLEELKIDIWADSSIRIGHIKPRVIHL